MQIADLTNPNTNPLPMEVQELVAALIEGRVHSLAIVAEITNHEGECEWLTGYSFDMDENETDEMGFLGAIALMQRKVANEIDTPVIRISIIRPDDDDEAEDE